MSLKALLNIPDEFPKGFVVHGSAPVSLSQRQWHREREPL